MVTKWFIEPVYWHRLPIRSALGPEPLLTAMHNRIFWEDQFLFLLCLVLGVLSPCLLWESSSHKCSTAKKFLLNRIWKAVLCHAVEEQGPASLLPCRPLNSMKEKLSLYRQIWHLPFQTVAQHNVQFVAESGLLALSICSEVYWTVCLRAEFCLFNWDFSLICLSLRSWQENLSEDRSSPRS